MNYNLIKSDTNTTSPIIRILYNRGMTFNEIKQFLDLENNPVNYNPHLLNNIDIAAKLLLKTIVNQEKIYIQVDCDCDGYSSAAALLNYLHKVFPTSIENLITYDLHSSKHHGISIGAIADDIKLVVVPDASSNERDIHRQLLDKGIKTIVLDHHEYDENEEQYAIIVNCQQNTYPNHCLCGAGVVYKFCQVLDEYLGVSYADDILDLVALALVADMMDTKSPETRSLIMRGFKNIKNPFFYGLSEKNAFSMGSKINIFTISFYIAPYVNAMTRSGNDEEKKILFDSMLDYKAYQLIPSTKRGCKGQEEQLITQALRICANVKKHQDDSKKEFVPVIMAQIEEENLLEEPIVIVQTKQDIDPNLIGLLANQIMSEIGKTTIILRERIDQETGEITWAGSARGIKTKQVDNWREFIENSGFAEYAQGHGYAFGCCFTSDNLDKFRQYMRDKFGSEKFEKFYDVDFEWNASEQIDDPILDISNYEEIWGQGLAEPLVVIKHVPVDKNTLLLMKKGTVKVVIPNRATNCIKFNSEKMYQEIANTWDNGEGTTYITIIGKCAKNEWNGNVNPQIKIQDYEIEDYKRWVF